MKMDIEDAERLVEARINEPDPYWPDRPSMVINRKLTIERKWGWMFFYNLPDNEKSNSLSDQLAGNAPLIVNQNTGEIIVTGTAYCAEHYLSQYEQSLA